MARIYKGYRMTKQAEITDDMIQKIANDAVREAQRKSLENGIPNVYSKNGVMYFQLPDGTITMENPFEKGELKKRLDSLVPAS
jgi:hypothetical protein